MPEIPAASEIYWPHPVLKDNSSLNVGLTLLLSITSGAGNLNFGLKSYHVFERETNNKAGNFQNVTESALDYGWIFWLDLLMIVYSLSESCILDGRNFASTIGAKTRFRWLFLSPTWTFVTNINLADFYL